MKSRIVLSAVLALMPFAASAQVGAPYIHDPSTIMECDGKYYTFGTGENGIMSEDGWIWHPGAVRPHRGAAPDAIRIGDRYLVGFSSTGGGLGGGHAGNILTMWTKTLDPESPDFGYSEPVVVASSTVDEDCDAIDIGLFLDPVTGRLWCTYGTYFGFIRQVELDPQTGARAEGAQDINVAIDCEASDMIWHNGWYYLLGTHGTCCDGTNSTYNIVCGRSRSVNGPFIDNVGRDMLRGGGKMVAFAEGRRVGAGHFGRFIVEEGVEKTSFHWEADFDLSGRSTLAIRPLLWVNDWPVAGELFRQGTYAIISERRGYALELEVDFVRHDSGMRGWFVRQDEPVVTLEDQKLEDVVDGWPEGRTGIRISDYMNRPHQRWDIKPVPEAGGYLGGPWFKITVNGTRRALAATADREVECVPEFTGAPEQLWRIDQLTDGSYRIMPKEIPGCKEQLVLYSVADCTPTLAPFDMNSDNSKWRFKKTEGIPAAADVAVKDHCRNLFAEMGYPQDEIDARLKAVFDEVFRGPDKVYFEVGDDMAYISDIKNHDVRTEGMSYGMMIAVQFGEKDIFDRLWRWAKTYMQYREGPLKGYFAWSLNTDGTVRGKGPASDGELYFVTSLIFASNRWGNYSGINYLAEAQNILNCSWEKDGSDGVYPFINKEHHLITFTPEGFGPRFTDPSYHLPAFYEVWAKWADDGRSDFYKECARASREYLHRSIDPVTGLNPDTNMYDGSTMGGFGGRQIKPSFRYDSWRVPMNIALDYTWSGADAEWQRNYANTIQNFFWSKGIDDFVDQYSVDGTDVESIMPAGNGEMRVQALRHSVGLVATLAAVSLAADNEHSREFVDRLWNSRNEPYEDGYFDAYYDGLLRLFAFMHLSGNYRVIGR